MTDTDDSDSKPRAFSLDATIEHIRYGRAELVARKLVLAEQKIAIEDELTVIESDIARIDALNLLPRQPDAAQPAPGEKKTRTHGVLGMVSQAIEDETLVEFTITGFVAMFYKLHPEILPASVRSALARCADGRIIHGFQLEAVSLAGGPGYRVNRVALSTRELVDVREQIAKALLAAGPEGLTRAQLAWERSDVSNLDEALRDPMFRQLGHDQLGHDRWVLASDAPQRQLFPGADAPG